MYENRLFMIIIIIIVIIVRFWYLTEMRWIMRSQRQRSTPNEWIGIYIQIYAYFRLMNAEMWNTFEVSVRAVPH